MKQYHKHMLFSKNLKNFDVSLTITILHWVCEKKTLYLDVENLAGGFLR
jgi:hypothetical protein